MLEALEEAHTAARWQAGAPKAIMTSIARGVGLLAADVAVPRLMRLLKLPLLLLHPALRKRVGFLNKKVRGEKQERA